MRGGEKMKKLLLLLVLVFTVSAFAYGDTSMLYMLEDPQEEPRVFGFYDYTYYLEADVKGQDTDFTMHQQSAGCLVPFNIDQDSELFFYAKFDQIKWDTDAMFTGTNVSLPNDVYDLNLFTGYKQVLDNGWLVGGVAQFGSASDKLFHSADELFMVVEFSLKSLQMIQIIGYFFWIILVIELFCNMCHFQVLGICIIQMRK